MSIPISVWIQTLNEERDLPRCLDSVRWSDDIVVLDSGSTDSTQDIARRAGCRVFTRPFDDSAAHQNWGLRNLPFRHEWVLNLDADERASNELAAEIAGLEGRAGDAVAFRMRRKDYYRGTWIKHAGFYPTWLVRLYRPQFVQFRRLINSVAEVGGTVGSLGGHIEHWPFSKGVSHWIARHNSYSSFEAMECAARPDVCWNALISGDPYRRRAALKVLFSAVPAKPLVKFLYLYLWHRGFLDGRPGLDYCLLQSVYEYFIALKTSEMELAGGEPR
jgi:glycosyltransferase involved in cell wall biosynthesis